jgi:hypothetical protein
MRLDTTLVRSHACVAIESFPASSLLFRCRVQILSCLRRSLSFSAPLHPIAALLNAAATARAWSRRSSRPGCFQRLRCMRCYCRSCVHVPHPHLPAQAPASAVATPHRPFSLAPQPGACRNQRCSGSSFFLGAVVVAEHRLGRKMQQLRRPLTPAILNGCLYVNQARRGNAETALPSIFMGHYGIPWNCHAVV